MEDDFIKLSGMAEVQIWQKVYAAAVMYGHDLIAVDRADRAVLHYRERTKLSTPTG